MPLPRERRDQQEEQEDHHRELAVVRERGAGRPRHEGEEVGDLQQGERAGACGGSYYPLARVQPKLARPKLVQSIRRRNGDAMVVFADLLTCIILYIMEAQALSVTTKNPTKSTSDQDKVRSMTCLTATARAACKQPPVFRAKPSCSSYLGRATQNESSGTQRHFYSSQVLH